MKTITLVVVSLSLISLAILFLYRASAKETNNIPALPTVSNQLGAAEHPLSIESLKKRQFPPQTFSVEEKVSDRVEVVSYRSDGFRLNALKIIPQGSPPSGGWPIVIVNHGYIPPPDYRVKSSYINTSNFFASNGFVVLKPDYRGHDQSEGESLGRLFSRSEYTVDVLNLISTIDSLPDINKDRIFMYGHSMGGEVTLQVMEVSSRIKAATLWAPAVTSLPEAIEFYVRRRPSPGQIEQFRLQYDDFVKNFPISHLSSIDNLQEVDAPLNLHHGTADKDVPYDWGVALNDKLKDLNKTVNFYTYNNDNHDISGNFGRALTRDVDFFRSIP